MHYLGNIAQVTRIYFKDVNLPSGNLPPRLAKLQQQQMAAGVSGSPSQGSPVAPLPPSQQQAMMMMQDGQMPIPLPNTSVPPPPLQPKEEISLRPNRNFTGALRPSVPTMLPKSAQASPSSHPPLMSKEVLEQRANALNPLLAKQVTQCSRQDSPHLIAMHSSAKLQSPPLSVLFFVCVISFITNKKYSFFCIY